MDVDEAGLADSALRRGLAARAAGDHASAVGLFEEALARRPGDSRAEMALADTLRDLGAFDRAEPVYRRLLAREPQNVGALMGLGHSLRGRGNSGAALPFFRQALELRPREAWARMAVGDTLRGLGRLEEAEPVYRQLLQDEPRHAPAMLGLGQVLRERGRHAEALALFEAALAARPEDPWAALAAAETLRALGRLDAAESTFRSVLSARPDQVQALMGLGHLLRSRGDPAGALPLFEQALALRPGVVWAAMALADTLLQLGQLARAEIVLGELLALRPGHVPALIGLGRAAARQGRASLAAERFRRALDVEPENIAARLALAAALADAGDYDRALAAARAADRGRTNPELLRGIGQIQLQAGRPEEALDTYRALAAAQPGEAGPLVEAARIARQLGRFDEAAGCVAEALRRQPDHVGALLESAEQARLGQRPQDALSVYDRAAELEPANWRIGLGRSQALVDSGEPGAALELLEVLEREHPGATDLRAKRVQLLQQTGRLDLALAAAREGVQQDPQHFWLWAQWSGLERLTGHFEIAGQALERAPVRNALQRARVLHHRGQLLEEQCRFAEAIACYREAADLDPRDHATCHDLIRALLLVADTDGAAAQLHRLVDLGHPVGPGNRSARNRSQTHLGHILDEWRLDGAGLRELQELGGVAAESRIEPLLEIARRRPDYTPAAIFWLVALRQAGKLAAAAQHGGGAWRPIPCRIAQYWDSDEIPADLAEMMRSWPERHPGWDHRVFNDRTARDFLERHCAPPVLRAYRRAREPAQKADLLRLAWLQVNGGFWIDADDRCLAPLDSVFPPDCLLALYQEDLCSTGNDVIGAVPQHPVVAQALQQAVAAVNRGDEDLIWLATGPGLLTRSLVQVIAGSPLRWESWLDGIAVLSRSALQRAVGLHCLAAYKRGDRHWMTALAGKRNQAAQ